MKAMPDSTSAPAPGRPKAGPAPSGGSDPRSGGAWGQPFGWPVRVYWEDTDAGGIVFYANYLKFFERARTEWLRHLGIGQQALREQVAALAVKGAEAILRKEVNASVHADLLGRLKAEL